MKNTVIFDMDGVLVDTEPIHQHAFFEHFKELNIKMSVGEYSQFKGYATKNLYQRLREDYKLNYSVDELTFRKREIFNEVFNKDQELDLFPGVRNLIEALYKEKFQLILATSSARVTQGKIFERFKLNQYFTHIVSGEDFPMSKPDPSIFLKAVELSKEEKSKCIVIEDSMNGVIAAKLAGVYCIGFKDSTSDQDLSKADQIIYSFDELSSEIIRKIR